MSNYYQPVGGLSHLGQMIDQMPGNGTALAPPTQMSSRDVRRIGRGAFLAYGTIVVASSGASAYHGYKRSRGSVGAAIGWGLLGGMFPIITPIVALAQGFGKPKVKSNRRRRRRRTSRRRR